MSGQILQMLSADGWFATYRVAEGAAIYKRVICWALIEGEESGIYGMCNGIGVSLCEDQDGFEGYIHEEGAPNFRECTRLDQVERPQTAREMVEKDLLNAIRELGEPSLAEVAKFTRRDRSNCYRQLKKLVEAGKIQKVNETYLTRYRLV